MGEKIKMITPEARIAEANKFLDFASNFPISDQISPETFRGFLNDYRFGEELCGIAQSFGGVHQNSAGYQQLHASHDGRYLVGTYYPGQATAEGYVPAAFHAFFGPGGQHQETTAITFFEDGRPPLVQKSVPLDKYGRKEIVRLEDNPGEAWAEIQTLAGLVKASLPAEQVPQMDVEIEQLAA